MHPEQITLRPIGFVRSWEKEVGDRDHVSEIVIRKEFTEALEGTQDFSHLFVIFWMHEIEEKERVTLKTHPRGRKDLPLLGVFATRTPYRPNPIGLTVVQLQKVKDNIITVRGLDAFDGTPVLDIKPFDYWDTVKADKVPDWWMRLEKERSVRKENQ